MKATTQRTLVALGLAMTIQGTGYAAPAIVTDWQYTLTSQWTAAAPYDVTITPFTLSWGEDAGYGQSSLVITNPAANSSAQTYVGVGMPDASYVASSVTLTHNNNPIYAPSLTSATLTTTLSLQALLPTAGSTFPLPSITYNILFAETPNVTGGCAVTSSPTPCNDIFVQTTGLLNTSFNYENVDYYVNIFPTNGNVLTTLPDNVCAAASSPQGCIGFTTPEQQSTSLPFGFTISAQLLTVGPPTNPVPEPGSLLLLGTAVLGLGFSRRKLARS